MPKAKSKVKIIKTASKKTPVVENALSPASVNNLITTVKKNIQNPTKKTYLGILIIGLILLAIYNKSFFVAAIVNGQPVVNFELLYKMNQQFRDQTLNQLINEKIIYNEAVKNHVTATPAEVNQKIAEIEQNVGGAETLDMLLQQQGQTRGILQSQLQVQIIIEKLYSNEATVSAEEVADYITQNQTQLKASDSAGQTLEATDALKQQKLGQIFNDKFQQLKQSAKVIIF
ncbi:MAG: SurA N-terminal domain-containing protein [Candidatus Daviesbacteria bacterium]|nr:SurA N-terminal domain-containing protein [Candidatus Daviesbacteria bacterium]